jgi:hypothetical protein
MNRAKRLAPTLTISLPSALLVCSVIASAALAQVPDNSVCPLSDDQVQKSIQAFDKIAKVFTGEPRCVNCHGGVNPFGADAREKHGGGKRDTITKTEIDQNTGQPETVQDDAATFQQCGQCHGAFPGRWHLPPAGLLFAGKDAFTLCNLEKDTFFSAKAFVGHIEHDLDPDGPFVEEAFTGRMGLTGLGQSLAAKYPAPPIGLTHQDLNWMAQDWVDAQGGEFVGGPDCGCKKHHYAVGVKETAVEDRGGANGFHSHSEMSGQGDIPLTFKEDGSFTGEATLPEAFTHRITTPVEVCISEGAFPNRMKVTGSMDKVGDNHLIHLKFSWSYDFSNSGTCTGKGWTVPFKREILGVTSAGVKGPMNDGFDMPGSPDQTREVLSGSGNADQFINLFKFTHTITIKQID